MPKKGDDFGDDARAGERYVGSKSNRHDEAYRRDQNPRGRHTDRSSSPNMKGKGTAWDRSPNVSPEPTLNFIDDYMRNPERYQPQDGSHKRDTAKRQVAYETGKNTDPGAVTQQNMWESYRNTNFEKIEVKDFAQGGYPYKRPSYGDQRSSSASGDKGKGKGKEPERGSGDRGRDRDRDCPRR
jgi:hypothetical protein